MLQIQHTKILKHVQTRWLSIGVCLDRILENWSPLLGLFREAYNELSQEQKAADTREKRMMNFYRSPTNQLYCLFLRNVIKVFDKFNTRYQQEVPLIHSLRRDLRYVVLPPCPPHPNPMSKILVLGRKTAKWI